MLFRFHRLFLFFPFDHRRSALVSLRCRSSVLLLRVPRGAVGENQVLFEAATPPPA